MSCRTTYAGSALTSAARIGAGRALSDVQVLSTFHTLRNEGRGAAAPTQPEWDAFVTEQQTSITTNEAFSDARRASLTRRLEQARTQLPDGRTWHAVQNLTERVTQQSGAVNTLVSQAAVNLGMSQEQTRERFNGYMNEIDRSRNAAPPEGYSEASRRAVREFHLPEDPGTVHAVQRLMVDERRSAAAAALAGPQRVERRPVRSAALATAGYDPDGGRLEVTFRRRGDDGEESRVYAYRGVPAEVWEEISAGNAGAAYNQHVRNNPDYRYEDQESADIDSAARRCDDCGQFASSSHACPVRREREIRVEAFRVEAEQRRVERQRVEAQVAAVEAAIQEAQMRVEADRVAEIEREAVEQEQAMAREAERVAAEQAAALNSEPEPDPEPVVASRPEPVPMRGWARGRSASTLSSRAMSGIIRVHSASDIRRQAAEGPVSAPFRWAGYVYQSGRADNFVTSGEIILDRPARGRYDVSLRNVRCTCAAYQQNSTCPHVDLASEHLRAYVTPTTRTSASLVDPEAAQRQVEETLRLDYMRSEAGEASARARFAADAEVSYTDNFEKFEEDHNAAVARKAAGEEPVPFMTENATGGLCSLESGRGFGVELEFDFGNDVNQAESLESIGRELHEAGLTPTPHQDRYHASARRGYTSEHQGGWSFERDGTVSGEIVSPVMYDTPETWANVKKVCEIVQRHGGKATTRTGSHVHVGVGSYGTDARKHTELLRTVGANEDVMYRISSNPEAAQHRSMSWCGPNAAVPPDGYQDLGSSRYRNNSHRVGVNLQSVVGRPSDHAEIRHWDGTLNPAVIQTQVKISAAMIAAAERNAGVSDERPRETVGSHAVRGTALRGRSRRALTGEELRDDTATARAFIDTLFSRAEDKAQAASLFAVTKWMRRPARRQ